MAAPLPTVPYAELRARTAFSFGDGVLTPQALVSRAIELGYNAIGITDVADLGGIVRAKVEAGTAIKIVVGAELIVDGHPVAVLARDKTGCQNLAALVTQSRVGELTTWSRTATGRVRGKPSLTWKDFANQTEGLHLLTGPALGPVATLVQQGRSHDAERLLHQWRADFSGNVAVEVQRHQTGGAEAALAAAVDRSRRTGMRAVGGHE